MANVYDRRRPYCSGDIEYLLDDVDGTAWLSNGKYNGSDICILPEEVSVGGRTYRITSAEGEFTVKEGTLVQELVIPDSYEYLGDIFFSESYIEAIHIGRGLRWLNAWCFHRLSPDVAITIDPENPHIKMSEDGNCILTKDGRRLISVAREVLELTIPNGVVEICPIAISCFGVERLTLPSSLKVIGSEGICQCHGLHSLVIPEGVETIHTQGLSDNRNLKEIDLPSTLRQLDGETFVEDNCLERIIVRAAIPPTFKGGMDLDLTRINTCFLVVPRQSLPAYRNHTDWGWFRHIDILDGDE
jgi:hypothetical protein